MNGRICPLFFSSGADLEEFECRPDRCAWWEEERGRCALVSIAQSLSSLDRDGIGTYQA